MKLTAATLGASLVGCVTAAVAFAPARDAAPALTTTTTTVILEGRYRGDLAETWAARYRQRTRELQATRRHLRRRWAPTVDYAIKLASAVSGIPEGELRTVAWCESRFYPFAANGRYLGLFQLGWRPLGLDPYDPVANALSAALTVKHDRSWRQWECKP